MLLAKGALRVCEPVVYGAAAGEVHEFAAGRRRPPANDRRFAPQSDEAPREAGLPVISTQATSWVGVLELAALV